MSVRLGRERAASRCVSAALIRRPPTVFTGSGATPTAHGSLWAAITGKPAAANESAAAAGRADCSAPHAARTDQTSPISASWRAKPTALGRRRASRSRPMYARGGRSGRGELVTAGGAGGGTAGTQSGTHLIGGCCGLDGFALPSRQPTPDPVSYTHLRAHETVLDLVCRLLLEKKKKN